MASIGSTPEPQAMQTQSESTSLLRLLRQNFWGLATLAIVGFVCLSVVNTFKKPGQMTVIESQAMDMTAMVPPVGAVPVALAKVERNAIEASVTYTGTAQAFEDEDIYPRVTGKIVKMPVYPGDRVKKGDLLVQLDPSDVSEYKAKLQEAKDEADAEMHNAGIAKEDFRQKEFEYKAALEEESAAKQAVAEAEADLSYWKPEIERQKKLYEKDVVSLAEYQQEESSSKAASAKWEQAKAILRAASNKKMAAEAAFNATSHHISHQYLQAKKFQAAAINAQIYDNYTRIRSKDDGVVTKRMISPGVVVNPGMLILKVARVKQMRLQAEVSEEDASKIKLGDHVFMTSPNDSKEPVEGSVTSIFPAADASTRTFIIEALVDNIRSDSSGQTSKGSSVSTIDQYYFLPGQYVVMRIVTGMKNDALTIPSSALVWTEGKAMVWKASGGGAVSGPKRFSCLMHPELVSDKPGKCPKCGMQLEEMERGGKKIAQLVDVTVGLSNPDLTEITSGLQNGDEVISAGYENLSPGTAVVPAEWGEEGPAKLPTPTEVKGTRLDAGSKWTLEQTPGDLMLEMSLTPSPPKSGDNQLIVRVMKHGGGAMSGVKISGKSNMPGMNMPGPDLSGTTDVNGEARIKTGFSSGPWQAELTISPAGGASVETTIDIEVP